MADEGTVRFSGVARDKRSGRWRARYTRTNGKRTWLKDDFATAEEAAEAYDEAVLEDGLAAQPLNFTTREEHAAKQAAKQNKRKAEEDQTPSDAADDRPQPKAARTEDAQADAPSAEAGRSTAPAYTTTRILLREAIGSTSGQHEMFGKTAALVSTCAGLLTGDSSLEKLVKSLPHKLTKEGWRATGNADIDSTVRLFSIDCEMVLCRQKGTAEMPKQCLARVSVVECTGFTERDSKRPIPTFETKLDEFVRIPMSMEVVDYMTDISGITQEIVESAQSLPSEIHTRLIDLIRASDVVIGHSLAGDFEALKLWHGNFVDTSLLCRIDHMRGLTLSLKDIAELGVDKQSPEEVALAKRFQVSGESHDSVQDAEWSARAAFNLISLAEELGEELPLHQKTLPERFQSRINFRHLPANCSEMVIKALVQKHLQVFGATADISGIDFKFKRVDGRLPSDRHTTCSVTFTDVTSAQRVFDNLGTVQSGCGNLPRSPPAHRDGYPSVHGTRMKAIPTPSMSSMQTEQGNDWVQIVRNKRVNSSRQCLVTSFFPVDLSFKEAVSINAGLFGRVIGKQGRTILAIQQISGARLSVQKQPEQSNDIQSGIGEVLIEADDSSKLDRAKELIIHALDRKLG